MSAPIIRGGEADLSLTFAKSSSDRRHPVAPRLDLELGDQHVSIDLSERQFVQLMSGSVISVLATVGPA